MNGNGLKQETQRHAPRTEKHIRRTEQATIQVQDDRTGMDVETLKRAFFDNLYYIQAKDQDWATAHDFYMALAYTVRDRLLQRWIKTVEQTYQKKDVKVVCYLSAEYLLGRQLGKNLINVGLHDQACQVVQESGYNLYDLLEQEDEPGLGNGGLGRLAACFMDSLSTLEIPAIGYGIRYEYGIFKQQICNGAQVERPDRWLRFGNPWEIPRLDYIVEVKLGGHTEAYTDELGRYQVRWIPERTVLGVAQRIYPAADLSEQLSTAGKEASGTSNMKFAMNGALTIGTLDGANVEIRDRVGAENFFLFGLTAPQVSQTKAQGYNPWEYYNSNAQLRQAIDQIASGDFSKGDKDLFKPLVESLKNQDEYLLFADFQSYIDTQQQVSDAYRNQDKWLLMSILNTARTGYFSSDLKLIANRRCCLT